MKTQGIVLHPAAEKQFDSFLATPTHALLLAGSLGSGKTHVAAALAAQLLHKENLENEAYYRKVVAEKGTISIGQIRALSSFFRLKVPGGNNIKRVAVLQDADSMGLEAQNALLKLLEEPPTDSVLILTSSRPERLLPTIRSRVQLLMLPNPTADSLHAHFKAEGYEDTAISAALLRSGTDIAEAERLLRSEEGDDTVGLVKQVLSGSTYDRLLTIDRLTKQKEAASAFTDTLATVAMVSLHAAAGKASPTVERWKKILQAAHEAQESLDRNGNVKLVLTELMLAL